MLCLFFKANAQTNKISGTVYDRSAKTPLAGANIKLNSTGQQTKTNADGQFSLTITETTGRLIISYLGYQPAEISFSATENNPINVYLDEEHNNLKEIEINAGYYTVKDKERTGSISRITAETIEKQPISNPLQAMQGRMAGLIITQKNGIPGSDFSVQLRGKNSIQSGTSPLYLIDGVPYISETLAQSTPIGANSPLNSISPSDIESIEVLKDADATAIYGSKGANGVILITTKKGKPGKTTVDFNLYTGFGKITRNVDLMNTQQYIQMRKEAFANDKVQPTLALASDLLAWDNNRYTDFQKLLIGNTSHSNNAQLRISGGSANTNFSFGTSYYKETTVFPGENGLDRKDASLNLSHSSTDNRFIANLSAGYAINNSNIYASDLTSQIILPPNTPALYDENGKLNWAENGANFSNPMALTLQESNFKTDRFNSNAVLGYKILPGLELKTTAGYNTTTLDQYSNNPISAQNPANAPKGNATFGVNTTSTWIAEPQLSYIRHLGNYGKISLLLGGTWQGTTGKSSIIRGSGYTNDLLIHSIDGAATKTATNDYSQYNYQAVFARLNYSLKDRYFLNLSGRRDGSSRFGPGKQFANFGAIGTAWVFSEESFIKESLPWLSLGKLRASYGITGNDQISNYQFLDSYISTDPYGTASGLIPLKIYNSDYRWEENRKFETALELGFFGGRVNLTASYFRNISGNQLVSYSLAGQTGFPSVLKNLDAKVKNQGFEFELQSLNMRNGRFRWSTSANLTVSSNKLLAFPGLESSSYASSYVIGEPLTLIRGYHYIGINQTTGAYLVEDKTGDGLINTGDYYNLGTKDPVFYGGLQNTWEYAGFQLDVFFQFSKQKGTDPVYGSTNLAGGQSNVPAALLDRWTKPGDLTLYQAYSQSTTTAPGKARLLIRSSDAALVDASFIRLKNVSLSYSLPTKLIDKIRLSKAKVYLQAQNLLTISGYKNADPETQSATTLPPIKMITIGAQLTF